MFALWVQGSRVSVESLRMSLTEADTSKKTNLDAFIPDIWRHRQLVMAA